MKILVSYRGIPQSPGWATGDMVVDAFRELGHEVHSYAKYYQTNKWVEDHPGLDYCEWDLVLFLECNDCDPQYQELRITKTRKFAGWFFDTSYYTDRCSQVVKYFGFDHVFLANPLTIQEYKVGGFDNVSYLPYACSRKLHERSLEYPKTRDVALVGSIRDDRLALADEFAKHDVDFELIGGVFREDYIDALASSRIIINQNPLNGLGLLNMRHFEAQAAGCFLLEQWRDLKSNIDAGLVCTGACMPHDNTAESYIGICKDYLAGDKESITLTADSEKKYFFRNNTYKARCQTILDTLFPHERD